MIASTLLSPGKIGTMTVKNRVIMSSMLPNFAEDEGFVNDRVIDYYTARAKGGCGLVSIELTAVHPTGQSTRMLGIYDDKFMPGLTKLAAAVKAQGAKVTMQIGHIGRQIFGPTATGVESWASSEIPCPMCGIVAHAMTEDEIWEVIEAYGDCAVRARDAGYDAVEVHCAHGYLIQNFLTPRSNNRTDQWGGSYENRSRLAREVMKNVRSKVGYDFPVYTRISAEEMAEGGLQLDEQIKFAKDLEAWGSDAIDVSLGTYGLQKYLIPPIDMPRALNKERAKAIKAAVNIPVIVVGRINDPLVAEEVLNDGAADFVAVGRGHIADPEFVNKTARGDLDSIIRCIGCEQGCMGSYPSTCMRNPAAGREAEFELKPAAVKKKVLVAGGGPGGLQAATMLKRRGHDVILCEKSSSLGGHFVLAGIAPRKSEMKEAALQMGRIAVREGVDVRYQTEVTPEVIDEIAPDAVVVATGFVPALPQIEGIENADTAFAVDVMAGTKTVKENVLIIGGNGIGAETADFLSESGKKVTILHEGDRIAPDVFWVRNQLLMDSLVSKNVQMYTNTKCVEIKGNTAVVEINGEKKELGGYDSIVIATGAKCNDTLSAYLEQKGIEHYVIGDAKQIRFALDAIREGAETALVI